MKRTKSFIAGLLIASGLTALAAGVDTKFPGTDLLKFGVSSSSDDKAIEFDTGDGVSNVKITVDNSRDTTLNSDSLTLGDGTAGADKDLVFDNGASPAPRLRYNVTSQKFEQSDDGTIFKSIGSGSGGGFGATNILSGQNNDFEDGDTLWTESGSSVFSIETTNPLFGTRSGKWDPSTTGENLDSELISIGDTSGFKGLQGQACLAEISYLWESGVAGEIVFSVHDGSSVLHQVDLTPTSGIKNRVRLQFTCPSSGSIRIRLSSTANAAEITLDNAYLGERYNQVELSNAEVFGTLHLEGATTDCSSWSLTQPSGFNSYSADADCLTGMTATGNISLPDTGIPGFKVPVLAAGYKYQIVATGAYTIVNGSATGQCYWKFYDGTSSVDGIIHAARTTSAIGNANTLSTVPFSVSTTQTDVTYQIQAAMASGDGSSDCDISTNLADVRDFDITVYRWPIASQTALSVSTSQVEGTLVWPGTAGCNWTTTSGSYADFSANGSCTNPTVYGSAEAPGTKVPHGVFNNLPAGTYEVLFQAPLIANTSSSGNEDCKFRLTSDTGTMVGAEARSFEIVSVGAGFSNQIHGRLTLSSFAPQVTVKAQSYRTSGDDNCEIGVQTTDARMTLTPVTEFKTVHFDNLVNSTAQAGRKLMSALVANSGTPAVTRQDGSWIDSLDDNGVGDTNINLVSGVVATSLECRVTGVNSAVANCQLHSDATTSDVRVLCWDSTESAVDTDFMIECTGY